MALWVIRITKIFKLSLEGEFQSKLQERKCIINSGSSCELKISSKRIFVAVPAALVPPPALPPREFNKVSPVPENNNNPFRLVNYMFFLVSIQIRYGMMYDILYWVWSDGLVEDQIWGWLENRDPISGQRWPSKCLHYTWDQFCRWSGDWPWPSSWCCLGSSGGR